MRFSHLHSLIWNSPLRLLAGEIKFRPLRAAKLSGTYEDKRGQLQGGLRYV